MVDGSYESWCYGDNCRLVTFYFNTYHIAMKAENILYTKPKISFRPKKPNREANFEWFWSSRAGIYWWILMVDGWYESWCYGDNCRLVTFYSNTYHIALRAEDMLYTKTKIGFLGFWRVKLNLPRMKPFLPKNIGLTRGFCFSEHFLQHWGSWSNLRL